MLSVPTIIKKKTFSKKKGKKKKRYIGNNKYVLYNTNFLYEIIYSHKYIPHIGIFLNKSKPVLDGWIDR